MIHPPALGLEELIWSTRGFDGATAILARTGDVLSEGEWMDGADYRWRFDVGSAEVEFSIPSLKLFRVAARLLPDNDPILLHEASDSKIRNLIEIGENRYRLVKLGLAKTAYWDLSGTPLIAMSQHRHWRGGLRLVMHPSECPDLHSWALVGYAGYRMGLINRFLLRYQIGHGIRGLLEKPGKHFVATA